MLVITCSLFLYSRNLQPWQLLNAILQKKTKCPDALTQTTVQNVFFKDIPSQSCSESKA